jgi:hypothetical protein
MSSLTDLTLNLMLSLIQHSPHSQSSHRCSIFTNGILSPRYSYSLFACLSLIPLFIGNYWTHSPRILLESIIVVLCPAPRWRLEIDRERVPIDNQHPLTKIVYCPFKSPDRLHQRAVGPVSHPLGGRLWQVLPVCWGR